jgi:ABC-type dipeptide/oligopeptide/nickel transport system ATPase component
MAIQIKKAVRAARKLRIALIGQSKSGKTLTALKLARALVGPTGKIGVVDTEGENCNIYAQTPEVGEFDVIPLETFNPRNYVEAWEAFQKAGYDAVVTDSLSHAWAGKGGCIDIVDQAGSGSNKFTGGWGKATPLHNELITAINQLKVHHIATMRQKVEYVLEQGANGKTTPKRVGMAAVQREGIEYEFDITATMSEAEMQVDGIRGVELESLLGKTFRKPGADFIEKVKELLSGNISMEKPAPESPNPKDEPKKAQVLPPFDAAATAVVNAKSLAELEKLVTQITDSKRLTDEEKTELCGMAEQRQKEQGW